MRLRVGIFASVFLIAPCAVVLLAAPGEDTPTPELVNRYQDAARTQHKVLNGMQMEVDIDASLAKLEKRGKLRALRSISKLGRITYKMLDFFGDNTIKKEVIARYLQTDSDARENGTLAISPTNYKFREKATLENNGRRTHIFEIKPRKKIVGLFEGELWLDEETGMPVREAGRFVKNPSVFLKKVEFVREYQIREGVSYPLKIESTADVRVFGKAQLNISFSNFTRAEATDEDQEQAPQAAPEPPVEKDLLSRYRAASQAQQKALLSVAMEVEIAASQPKRHQTGRLNLQRDVSKQGAVSYSVLGYSGDPSIRMHMLGFLPKLDGEGHDWLAPGLSTDTYKFREKKVVDYHGRQTHVFEFRPKSKGGGIAEGELWLDAQTAMPVHETGRLLRSPSLFLKKVEYVRDFEIREGVAYPTTSQSTADVRLAGRTEVAFSFRNFSKLDTASTADEASGHQ